MITTNNLEAAHQKAELEVLKKELGIIDDQIKIGDASYKVTLNFTSGVSQTGTSNDQYLLKIEKQNSVITATTVESLKRLLRETLSDFAYGDARAATQQKAPVVTGEVIDGNPAITIDKPLPPRIKMVKEGVNPNTAKRPSKK